MQVIAGKIIKTGLKNIGEEKEKKIGRPSKIPTKRRLIEVCKLSKSVEEVAWELGISKRSVYRYIKIYKINLYNMGIPFRHPPVPDSIKLRHKICKTYLQSHSIIETYNQLRGIRWKRERITKVLKEEGFLIDPNTAAKVKKHFDGAHNVFLSNKLKTIIDGEVLADGQMFCQTSPLRKKHTQSLSTYLGALDSRSRLIKEQIKNGQDLNRIIEKYNKIVGIISKTQVAGLHIHKSLLEEPWLKLLANLFKKHRYSVTIVPPKKSIHLITQSTAQLYKEYKRWYPKGKKAVPTDLRLTPESVLRWYVGDGSSGKRELTFSTQSFNKADNKLLAHLLWNAIGVKAKVQPFKSRKNPLKIFYKLCIYSCKNIDRFFQYLEEAPKNSLSLARQLFPWKFDCTLRKKDVYDRKAKFVDDNYLETFLKLLKQDNINLLDRNEQLIYLFPWKFSIEERN
ncbi:MAG: hypothetical protein ACFE95_21660 [Candidatus Hodarchaeota archaeon]